MTSEQPERVSVIDPITPAIDRVKLMLFRPFELRRWFVIGFCTGWPFWEAEAREEAREVGEAGPVTTSRASRTNSRLRYERLLARQRSFLWITCTGSCL